MWSNSLTEATAVARTRNSTKILLSPLASARFIPKASLPPLPEKPPFPGSDRQPCSRTGALVARPVPDSSRGPSAFLPPPSRCGPRPPGPAPHTPHRGTTPGSGGSGCPPAQPTAPHPPAAPAASPRRRPPLHGSPPDRPRGRRPHTSPQAGLRPLLGRPPPRARASAPESRCSRRAAAHRPARSAARSPSPASPPHPPLGGQGFRTLT